VSRTAVVIVAVVAAALCAVLVVLLVWRPLDGRPPIETAALGVWQEATASLPVRMTVSAADEGADPTQYWVTYSRMPDVPFPARLDGDRLLVWEEDTQDVRWVIRYDEGADVLIVSRTGGGETHILRRVSE
jgi:hypothetical protein